MPSAMPSTRINKAAMRSLFHPGTLPTASASNADMETIALMINFNLHSQALRSTLKPRIHRLTACLPARTWIYWPLMTPPSKARLGHRVKVLFPSLRLCFTILCLGLASRPSAARNTNIFELRQADQVVLVGDTLIEREQAYGSFEFVLTTHYPDRHVTFRNLGWSADTPQGQSRVGFDHDKSPDFWFAQLTNSIARLKPSVVVLGYGMANSFDGEAGLPRFTAALNKLMDAIQHNAGDTRVRWVLLSPIPHERLPAPLPDPGRHNEQLAAYTKVIQEIAASRDAHFVNLFDALAQANIFPPPPPLTDDGIHLNGYGYRRAAEALGAGLNWEPHVWRLGVLAGGTIRQGTYGLKTFQVERKDDGARVVFQTEQLDYPPWLEGPRPPFFMAPRDRLQVSKLKPGKYDLKI
ncbi:MAG: hypothetical protein DME25_11080, partial [Verrucomicrobia bacterium]